MSTSIPPRGRLHDKVAIVTGSSSGMGRAIATLFSNEGARIVCVDIRPEARPEVPAEAAIPTHELLQKQGKQAIFVRTDVSQESEFEAAIESAVNTFGRLDMYRSSCCSSLQIGRGDGVLRLTVLRLVNNVGIVQALLPIHETAVEQWDTIMNVNARSVFLGCKHAIRQMLKQEPLPGADRGWIINLASVVALIGRAGIRKSSVSDESQAMCG